MKSDSFEKNSEKHRPFLRASSKIRNKIHASNNKTKAPQKLSKELRLSILTNISKKTLID